MTNRILLPTKIMLDPVRRAEEHVKRQLQSHRKRKPHPPAPAPAPTPAPAPPPAGGFDYPAQLVGTTPDKFVTVYYDPALGSQGATAAQQLLASAPTTLAHVQAYFATKGSPVNVIVAPLSTTHDGTGGAYHKGCDFTAGGDLYLDAAFGNPALETGLFVAELTECFMDDALTGWGCGYSNGEALSRFLAEAESGGPQGALSAFATGPAWNGAGRPNWISATDPTDQDANSTGCGVVYLYWMVSLKFSAAQITQAGCPDGTLASNYEKLTGKTTAWADFSAAVAALKQGVTSDNPWP